MTKLKTAISLFVIMLITIARVIAQDYLHDIQDIATSEKATLKKTWLKRASGLENNYDLKYHRFNWKVDPAVHYISGSVTSYFTSKEPTISRVQFELAANMTVDSAWSNATSASFTHEGNLVTIHLNNELHFNELDSVSVYYHGEPTETGFGSFSTGKHEETPVLWTLSEPYGASEWWPSKNDLTDKIDSIDVYVTHPKENLTASNGLLISELPLDDRNVMTHWKHRYPVAAYLIAIAVTNYARFADAYDSDYGSFEILNYVYPEDSAHLRNFAALALPVMSLFEELFGHYPFKDEKYGQAEFGWGGGMEHQTMTFLGRGAFNHEIIAHELAHQWFGDAVTCGSWHDIWLNEGFATYSAGITYEHFSPQLYWPKWKYQNQSYVTMKPGGMVFCDDTTSVDRIFDSRLSYSKGALVLHMLRWIVGDEHFYAGIRSYFNDPGSHFDFARTKDFKHHMEMECGYSLDWFFNDWIYSEGYPSYSLHCTQSPGGNAAVRIDQATSHPSVSFFKLPVPVYFYGNSRDTVITFQHEFSGQVFNIEPGFVIDSIRIDPERWIISAGNTVTISQPQGKYLTISPNPAHDLVAVFYNPDYEEDIAIVGMDGRRYETIYNAHYPGWAILDVKALPQGSYLLYIGKGKQTGKFLIAR